VTREDFHELKEGNVLEVCRTAGITDKNVHGILKEKLDRGIALPTRQAVRLSSSQAENYILDLLNNASTEVVGRRSMSHRLLEPRRPTTGRCQHRLSQGPAAVRVPPDQLMEIPFGNIEDAYRIGNAKFTAGELRDVFDTRLEMTDPSRRRWRNRLDSCGFATSLLAD